MRAVFALFRAELTMITRNRTATLNAVLIPLALGAVWIATSPPADGATWGATFLLSMLAGSTVGVTATTTLVARRNQQVLERWRSSGVAGPVILVGTLAPLCALLLLQAAIMFGAIAYATGSAPAHPFLLAVAAMLAAALTAAMAFTTAAFTRTVEAAAMTVLPTIVALLGGATWISSVNVHEVTWLMLATGGGAVSQLVRLAWDGLPAGAGLQTVGAALAFGGLLTGIAAAVAARTFRWSPRS